VLVESSRNLTPTDLKRTRKKSARNSRVRAQSLKEEEKSKSGKQEELAQQDHPPTEDIKEKQDNIPKEMPPVESINGNKTF